MTSEQITYALGAVSTLATSMVSIYVKGKVDYLRSKAEGAIQFKKEFALRKVKITEDIFLGIQNYRQEIDFCFLDLSYRRIMTSVFAPGCDRLESVRQKREKMGIYISLYFPSLDTKYARYADASSKLQDKITGVIKTGVLTQNDINALNKKAKDWKKADFDLVDSIRNNLIDRDLS